MFEDTKRGDQKAKSKKSKQYNGKKKKRGGGQTMGHITLQLYTSNHLNP